MALSSTIIVPSNVRNIAWNDDELVQHSWALGARNYFLLASFFKHFHYLTGACLPLFNLAFMFGAYLFLFIHIWRIPLLSTQCLVSHIQSSFLILKLSSLFQFILLSYLFPLRLMAVFLGPLIATCRKLAPYSHPCWIILFNEVLVEIFLWLLSRHHLFYNSVSNLTRLSFWVFSGSFPAYLHTSYSLFRFIQHWP
jgi:hypothetical protein